MRPPILLKISFFLPRLFERNLPVTTHEVLPSFVLFEGTRDKAKRDPQTKKECLLSTLAKRTNIQSLLNSKIMKKSFMLYIIACMSSFFLFVSCEQNELQKNEKPDTTLPVTPRTPVEDCEDCPVDNCCCVIEILFGGPSNLLFCGVYSGMAGSTCGTFTPPSPCATVSGISTTIPLNLMNPTRGLFCLPTGGSFRLENTGQEITIRITCQYGDITPDWEYIVLEEDEVLFFDSNSGCFLVECI